MRSDSTSAQLRSYATREISFEVYTSKPSLMVVSEIYYPAGWKAFVDSAETEIFKTNYVLRSLVVPGGKHTVVFRFNPETLEKGYTITQAAWGVSFLLILVGVFQTPWFKAKLHLSGQGKGDDQKETVV